MRRSVLLLASAGLAVLTVGLSFAVRAQDVRQAVNVDRRPMPESVIDRARAADVLRVINTAEYDYRRDHGSYGLWPELYTSGAVGKVQNEVNQWAGLAITAGPQVIPGYVLHLLVSRDTASYSVSLREAESNDCGFSVFSDESGLIYQGTVIDCPRVGDPPEPPRRLK